MPGNIILWNPKLSNQPINSVHYNWQVQTGALTAISTSLRLPEITLYPRITPVCIF